MTENLITIYKDDNIKIQIMDFIDEYLRNYREKFIKLKTADCNLLLLIVMSEAFEKETWKDKAIEITRKIPVISNDDVIQLKDGFGYFDSLLALLSYANEENYENIKKTAIELFENDSNAFINFFDKPIYKMNGYACHIENDRIFIMFLSIKDLNL